MAIELKEVTELDGLLSPVVAANTPREGELQGLAVEVAIGVQC